MNTATLLPQWILPPENMRICAGEIHVWRAGLDVAARELAGLQSALSEDERARAAAFHFARDQRRFIAGRGILRNVLARYLQMQPNNIAFEYGPSGKPLLAARSEGIDLRFNLSHADELALVAISRQSDVGVDLERIRTDMDVMSIAQSLFSPDEILALQAMPLDEQFMCFYVLWTAKEAYLKARGDGLAGDLASLGVGYGWQGLESVIQAGSSEWSLYRLEPLRGFSAAVVANGKGHRTRQWQWCGEHSADPWHSSLEMDRTPYSASTAFEVC